MGDEFLNAWDMAASAGPEIEIEDPYIEEYEPQCTCVEVYVDVDRTESFGPCDVHCGGAR